MEEQEVGICGICNLAGPLSQVQEHFMLNHVGEEESVMEPEQRSQEDDELLESGQENTEKPFHWQPNDVLLLIRTIEKYYELFDKNKKKNIWLKIAEELSKISTKKFTYDQVENKWKGLKKTYKKIKDHNNRTGNERKTWEFFYAMDNFMAKRPEITPPAVCSSSSGIKINEEVNTEIDKAATTSTTPESSFMRKRRSHNSAVDERHREKMAKYDQFLELFKLSVEHQIGKKD